MPRLSFITPAALVLLILLPLLWAFTLLTPRRVARWRIWAGLLIRSILLVALVGALAGAQLIRPVRQLTTVFLIDASDSFAPAQRERAVRYVEEALRRMPPGDQAAVVVFGANAVVERAPADLAALGRITSVPIATRTNIQDAIQLGLALLPADTQKRLVLLSDGGENSGRAVDAARLAAVRGVPLDVVVLQGERGPDVIVSALDVPSTAREGQEIALGVMVHSSFATTGRLQVFVDGQLVQEQNVTLAAGVNDLAARVPSGEAGFRRLEVRLDAQGDTEPQNNRAAAFTEVQGPPRFLLVASDASRAANLQAALEAAGVRVDLRPPAQAPADLAQLGAYAAVVIVDTPARDMPRALIEALPVYVRELGRGLAMIGGTDSFGAGGYRRTPLEQALPVYLDPLDLAQQPDLALVMVIDRSGSMGERGSSGRTKLDLAKEAVYQASLGLTQRDQIGLVVFDTNADWVLPLQQLPSAVDLEQALSSFGEGGGTDIRPGVEQAAQALTSANAKIKHVILLTDGIAQRNYDDLIDQMHAAGITISTVAIGEDADPGLEQIAARGGGRFYRVRQVEDVPRIFLQETVIVAGRDIIEGQFTPTVALGAPVVRGLGGLPPLYGYNGTEIKETARAILVTPDGKPVLAQWQYGLGRAVAWTSDLKGQWARDWIGWNQFPRFVSGLADMLAPPRDLEALELRASSSSGQAVLELIAQDDRGRPLNELRLEGRLIDPANQGTPLAFTQVGPGRYRAVTPATTPGVYLAQVAAAGAGGQPIGAVSTGLVVAYSPEYSDKRDNPQLLRDLAAITRGRVDPPAAAVFDPPAQAVGSVSEIGLPLLWLALLLWPIDIGLRRLHVRWADVAPDLAALRRRLRRRQAGAADQAAVLARLEAAKQRARTRNMAAAARRRTEAALERPSIEVDLAPAQDRTGAAPGPATESSVRTQGSLPRRAAPSHESPARADGPAAPPTPSRTPEAVPPSPPPTDEDQYARLLAAKQRARRRRER
jgi:uncharacterized membrane protein